MTTTQIIPLEHKAARVLTTKQLAEFYGCETRTISDNFNRNTERFIEGKHFFLLKGEELRAFRSNPLLADYSPNTPSLYLWTEKGAMRHAKILSTDKAWDVFEELEDTYFRVQQARQALPQTQAELMLLAAQIINQHDQLLRQHEQRLVTVERQIAEVAQSTATLRPFRRYTGWQVMGKFTEACIVRDVGQQLTLTNAYSAYVAYSREMFEGTPMVGLQTFQGYMRQLGYRRVPEAKRVPFRQRTCILEYADCRLREEGEGAV